MGLTFTTPNLLPVCWWDSQFLLGDALSAGNPELFHMHLPRTVRPFPNRYVATTSISGTSRDCCNPCCVSKLFESWLWGRIKLFKLALAKNYFPDTLLIWLCWNKVPLYSGSCGRYVVWHTISPPTHVLQVTTQASFSSSAGALLGCPPNQHSHSQRLSSVATGPAYLLQYFSSYNSSPSNL